MRQRIQQSAAIVLTRPRVIDFVALGKPELTLLSVLTAVGAAYLAAENGVPYGILLHTFVGTLLVGMGAGALNQYLERAYDALMKRTENRPLPGGRVTPKEAIAFGLIAATLGVLELSVFTTVLAGFLAIGTLATYLFLYTPLKRLTPFATVVGGVPGALPPVIGWAAVRGEVGIEAWTLFAILFFWQMPHFFALAWMYRKDYARGGYKVLTVVDPEGIATSRQIIVYSAALIPASLLPTYVGLLSPAYFCGAFVLSALFFLVALQLSRQRTSPAARRLFYASLAYVPAIILLMILDRL
jgi:protoheme IX farnesyltransferase